MTTRSTPPRSESFTPHDDDFLPHQSIPAWAASALLHAVIFVVLALSWNPPHRAMPNQVEADRVGEIALVQARQGRPEYFLEQATDSNNSSASLAGPLQPSALPGAEAVASNASDVLPNATELNGSSGGGANGLPNASGFGGSGTAARGHIGGQTTTGVFGVKATGTKFAYVFDRSASMNDLNARPLTAAKKQLLLSLDQLQKTNQFQIVFYNEQPSVFNPNPQQRPRMLFADDATKGSAESFVLNISGVGGTNHWDALKLALDMRPNVIFFLTDAASNPLTQTQLKRLKSLNERIGAQIHTIEFGLGPQRSRYNFLVQLADENNGQYVYIDVTALSK